MYSNRLSNGCTPCRTTSSTNTSSNAGSTATNPVSTTKPAPLPVGSSSLTTIECGKKILAITKIGERVLVVYNDCTYAVAPASVIDEPSFNPIDVEKVECIIKNLEILEKNQEILANKLAGLHNYDDTAITARITALETKEDKDTIYDDSAIKEEIKNGMNALTVNINSVRDDLNTFKANAVTKSQLISVNNLEGTSTLFKAFPAE